MRALCVMLVLGATVDVWAQEPPPSSTIVEQPPAPPPPPPPPTTASAAPVSGMSVGVPLLSEHDVTRWRGARTMQVFGSLIGLAGTGLTLSSTIYVLATGYPPKESDFIHPAKPTDVGPVLAYAGSGATALGFALSAGGLGWQHRILRELHADPGRSLYIGGTFMGVLGVVFVGTSYFLAFTNYLSAHDQVIAVLSTSLSGAALCTTGSILYAVDSPRLKKAWERLTTF